MSTTTADRWHAPLRALLEGRRVLVLGLGASGLAMADWCARLGAQVTVWDSREAPPQAQALAAAWPQVERLHGPLDAAQADGMALVLRSPGLAPHDERIAPLLARARAAGTAVTGELGLFGQALEALRAACGYAPKVIAITGTNGKTTTTSLTAQLLARAGLRVAAAGNIGPTMLATLAAALVEQAANDRGDEDAAAVMPNVVEPSPPVDDEQADEPALEAAAAPAIDPAAEPVVEISEPVAEDTPTVAEAGEPDAEPAPVAPIDPPPPPPPTFAHLPQAWVLELSSFQLDEAGSFEADAAAVLNVTQDHLDWHGDMGAYAQAKARVYGAADRLDRLAAAAGSEAAPRTTMIVNADDPAVEAMVPAPKPRKGARTRLVAPQVIRFGLGLPRRAGDWGVAEEGGIAWLVRALPDADALAGRRRGAATGETPWHLQRLMPADAMRIRGRHNVSNGLAALALASAVGAPLAPMLHGLREYRGEPHRVQHVGQVAGVDAYDDSKGTNVGATVAALQGLGADLAPRKLVVILGGDGKGQDFEPLVAPLAAHARAVALIGRDGAAIGEVIAAAAREAGIPMAMHADLQAATAWCFEQARDGDVVLLSPACASLDMFRDYAHRAQVFVDAVAELAAERGESLAGAMA